MVFTLTKTPYLCNQVVQLCGLKYIPAFSNNVHANEIEIAETFFQFIFEDMYVNVAFIESVDIVTLLLINVY